MAVKNHQLRGATLIESLTALAIITSVMGAAFTLYEKTVSKQQQVMKTRARLIQASAEHLLHDAAAVTGLSDDFVNVSIEKQPYHLQNEVWHLVLTITNKQGREILKKNYLRYQPE